MRHSVEMMYHMLYRNDLKMHGLLLTSSKDEVVHGSLDMGHSTQQSKGNSHWETLELYLVRISVFLPFELSCKCSFFRVHVFLLECQHEIQLT